MSGYSRTTPFSREATPCRANLCPATVATGLSGQAYVELNGKCHYWGVYGSAESHRKSTRLIAEWQSVLKAPASEPSIGQLTLPYLYHCGQHYRKKGEPTSKVQTIRDALAKLKRLHRAAKAGEFSPRMLNSTLALFRAVY